MNKPSFENIDQWFFEYTEGNLSSVQELQLLDFVQDYPELMEELKMWQIAKVSPETHPDFSAHSLTKKAPFLLRPYGIAFSSLLLVTIAWVGFLLYPSTQSYTMQDLDLSIIESGKHLSFAEEIKGNKTSTQQFNRRNDIQSEHANLQLELTQNTTFSVQDNHQEEGKPHYSNVETTENIDDVIEFIPTENNINKNEIINSTSQNYTAQTVSEKLDDVLAALEFTENTETEDQTMLAIENNDNQLSYTKANPPKNKKVLRKIKRIMNQPVALRSTQEPYYHIPTTTGTLTDFTVVGNSGHYKVQASSRLQWAGTENAQLQNTASWDGYIPQLKGGFGIDVQHSTYGMNQIDNYVVGLTYSPKFIINKNVSLAPAARIKMGVTHLKQVDELVGTPIEVYRNNLTPFFMDGDDVIGSQLWYQDIGLGFAAKTKWFYASLNADNLGRHNNNFYSSDISGEHREHIHYTAVIGSEYQPTAHNYKFNIYAFYQKYGKLNELWLGGNYSYKWIQFGVAANTNLDVAASAGFSIKNFILNYNIDYMESRLMDNRFLSHQISLKLLLKQSRKNGKRLNF